MRGCQFKARACVLEDEYILCGPEPQGPPAYGLRATVAPGSATPTDCPAHVAHLCFCSSYYTGGKHFADGSYAILKLETEMKWCILWGFVCSGKELGPVYGKYTLGQLATGWEAGTVLVSSVAGSKASQACGPFSTAGCLRTFYTTQ